MKINPDHIYIKDYQYNLPPDQIADLPLSNRSASRLLVYKEGTISEDTFEALANHFLPGSTIVLNDTRVLEARIMFQKPSGGMIEIFCLEPHAEAVEISLARCGSAVWKCLIGGASKWKHGLLLEKNLKVSSGVLHLTAAFLSKQSEHFLIEFKWEPDEFSFSEVLHFAGAIPLPPYIKRLPSPIDQERYQTVYGINDGSVAAPTSSLHFTNEVFNSLALKNIRTSFITLHVGAGTFKPVKAENIQEHQMHEEPFRITKMLLKDLMDSQMIIAAGTTTLRTLESVYWLGIKIMKGLPLNDFRLLQWEAYELEETAINISYKQSLESVTEYMNERNIATLYCFTSLIIVPGYKFKIPSALITNFHQPQSTLLLLVAAFIGEDWKKVYSHALNKGFRFLSYGDSSLLWRK
jgi:S-adenosylmethionine:tRNA ribosyltransferase-isomerase